LARVFARALLIACCAGARNAIIGKQNIATNAINGVRGAMAYVRQRLKQGNGLSGVLYAYRHRSHHNKAAAQGIDTK